jgi:hypothetical protein
LGVGRWQGGFETRPYAPFGSTGLRPAAWGRGKFTGMARHFARWTLDFEIGWREFSGVENPAATSLLEGVLHVDEIDEHDPCATAIEIAIG